MLNLLCSRREGTRENKTGKYYTKGLFEDRMGKDVKNGKLKQGDYKGLGQDAK